MVTSPCLICLLVLYWGWLYFSTSQNPQNQLYRENFLRYENGSLSLIQLECQPRVLMKHWTVAHLTQPTRSIFHPKQSSCGFPNKPPATQKPPGVWGGLWNRKDVRVRFTKKNKGPLGGGNSNILYVHLYLGKIPILTNIFQLGWNHQLGLLLLGFV